MRNWKKYSTLLIVVVVANRVKGILRKLIIEEEMEIEWT